MTQQGRAPAVWTARVWTARVWRQGCGLQGCGMQGCGGKGEGLDWWALGCVTRRGRCERLRYGQTTWVAGRSTFFK
eukprot:309182-Chlamydomonas_euryale.AAC.2